MPQSVQLKARGIYTFPNDLSEVPPGSLTEALNVVIDRNSVVEPRRGFAQFGNTFGVDSDRAKQLIVYKDRILLHYDDTLAFDSTGAGVYLNFAGTFTETQSGLRIKSIESNGNLYFTSSEGTKKISALTSSDFTTAADYITNAGGIKALDVEASPDYSSSGFLTVLSKVAYRVVWGITDTNSNLILGSPSARVVVENISSTDSSIVSLTFPVPQDVDSENFFYQIYRTGVFSAGTLTELEALDPGDEMNLVLEDFVTTAQISAGTVTASDISPEDFRQGGALLYTNPVSGDGIEQANEPPPFAKDITEYKGFIFYGNTSTRQRLDISQLSIQDLISGTSTLSISDGTTTRTYTYRGAIETYTADFDNGGGYPGKAAFDGKYFTITSANDLRTYKIWFDNTGSTAEPTLAGALPIAVDITGAADTGTGVAQAAKAAVEAATNDFNISGGAAVLTIANANNGNVTVAPTETIGAGFAISTDGLGDGEDASINEVFLPRVPGTGENGPSTSQQIDEAARSLVRVVNADTSGLVYAFYLSGVNDVPGQMLFERRDLTGSQFHIYANSTATAEEFNPELGVSAVNETKVQSDNEVTPNRVYYSKFQQPDAVPLVNFIDIGPKDQEIQRLVALRDSLFIFKEDGIYRLTGESDPFQVALFDSSAILQAPDSATVLNNLVYAFSTQGVITVTDTGVSVISRPIEDQLLDITRSGFSFNTASFGVSYETDRAYLLWTVTLVGDTVATQCFRYNSFTNTWTKWDKTAQCGLIKADEDKMFIGATDENFLERERKDRTRIDYADRQFTLSIIADNVDEENVKLSSVTNAEVGDVIVQTQYLTISQYNRLLRKLDIDPTLDDTDYESAVGASAGNDISVKMTALIAKLNADDGSIITNGFAPGDVTPGTDTIAIAAHGFSDNDIVYFTSTGTLPGGLSTNTKYYIISSTAGTFKVSTSFGGSAVDITSGGTGTHSVSTNYNFSGTSDFETIQTEFNDMSEQLEASSGVFFSSFPTSSGTVDQEGVITAIDTPNTTVTLSFSFPYIAGPVILYKAISTTVTWDNAFFQDPSLMKQVREGTVLFENNNFTQATVSYKTDLSPGFASVPFTRSGAGDWSQFIWSQQNWGGISNRRPIRTLIPQSKQRCRHMSPRFEHSTAFEKYSLLGMSLTFRVISERAYR